MTDSDVRVDLIAWVTEACAALGLEVAKPEDDFFEVGGTSLILVRLIARAVDEFGADALSPDELIESSTIGEIAATIQSHTA